MSLWLNSYKESNLRAGEMSQWLKALAAFLEDPGSSPSTTW